MIQMVKVNKQSVSFCKYTLALALWLALILRFAPILWLVLAILALSALLGVEKAPLVWLFDHTMGKKAHLTETYINLHSMRFAHLVALVFVLVALFFYYIGLPLVTWILTAFLAVLQTIASFGYCSAQKLYECVICNSNCCNLGKRIKRMKK